MNRYAKRLFTPCLLGLLILTPPGIAQNPHFKAVTDQLDKGGDLLAFMRAETYMREMEEIMDGLMPLMKDVPVPADEVEMGVGLLRKAYKTSGLKSLAALGISRATLPDGRRRNRAILQKGAEDGLLWSLAEGDVLPALKGLPANTVYASASSLRLDLIYVWLEMLTTGSLLEEPFAQATEQLAQMMDLPRTLKSVDQLLIAVRLSETETLELPGPDGEPLTVPQPGVVIELTLNDPYLFDFLTQMSAGVGVPISTTRVEHVEIRSLALPPDAPLPMPLSPSWSFHEGRLAFAETADALQAYLAGDAKTLGTTPAFAAHAGDAVASQVAAYVSPRLNAEALKLRGLQLAMLEQNQDLQHTPEPLKAVLDKLIGATNGEPGGAFGSLARVGDQWQMTSIETGAAEASFGAAGGLIVAAILAPALSKVSSDARKTELIANGKNLYTSVYVDAIDEELVGFPQTKDGYTGSTAYFKKMAGVGGTARVIAAAPEFVAGMGQPAAESWAKLAPANVGWSFVLDGRPDTDAGLPFMLSSNLKINKLSDDWDASVDRTTPLGGKVIVVEHGAGAHVLEAGTLNTYRDSLPAAYLSNTVLQP